VDISNSQEPSTVPSNRRWQFMARHPLFFFFLLAFTFTWIIEFLLLGLLHLLPLLFLAVLVGPTLSAFIMTGITERRVGVVRLLRRYVLWRVSFWWYLFVLIGIPALILWSLLISPGALTKLPASVPILGLAYLLTYLATFVLGGPLLEEPGWRGFALPRLQQRFGPLRGTLLLGILWGLWHLPLFLVIPGYNGAGTGIVGILLPFSLFLLTVVAFAVLFTWVFNHTKGSLLLVMLLHTSINTAANFSGANSLVLSATFVALAVVVIAITKGRLSYARYQRESEALNLPSSRQEPSAPTPIAI
jgi:CAAX protease family protein